MHIKTQPNYILPTLICRPINVRSLITGKSFLLQAYFAYQQISKMMQVMDPSLEKHLSQRQFPRLVLNILKTIGLNQTLHIAQEALNPINLHLGLELFSNTNQRNLLNSYLSSTVESDGLNLPGITAEQTNSPKPELQNRSHDLPYTQDRHLSFNYTESFIKIKRHLGIEKQFSYLPITQKFSKNSQGYLYLGLSSAMIAFIILCIHFF